MRIVTRRISAHSSLPQCSTGTNAETVGYTVSIRSLSGLAALSTGSGGGCGVESLAGEWISALSERARTKATVDKYVTWLAHTKRVENKISACS